MLYALLFLLFTMDVFDSCDSKYKIVKLIIKGLNRVPEDDW